MTDDSDKLATFLRDVSNWRWNDFVDAEHDEENYSSNQAIIFSLIRACVMRKLPAIQLAISRLDGKLATPVRVVYPKMYYIYPNATLPEAPVQQVIEPLPEMNATSVVVQGDIIPPPPTSIEPDEDQLPSMTFRQTLREMSAYPRSLPRDLAQLALQYEQSRKDRRVPVPDEIPRVKSVVAAHLLLMAHDRNLSALYEVFDQLDGKLVETVQVLGEDVYIPIYSSTAPPGAYLNDNGVLQLEATDTQDQWALKLGKKEN